MEQIWVGLVEVKPTPENEECYGAPGGFVNALALAGSESEYTALVSGYLKSANFDVVDILDLETFRDRLEYGFADDEIKALSETLDQNNRVALDDVHLFAH